MANVVYFVVSSYSLVCQVKLWFSILLLFLNILASGFREGQAMYRETLASFECLMLLSFSSLQKVKPGQPVGFVKDEQRHSMASMSCNPGKL